MNSQVNTAKTMMQFVQRDIADLKSNMKEMRVELGETRKEIHSIRTTDFWLLFGAIIAVTLGLAGLMAKGFGWL